MLWLTSNMLIVNAFIFLSPVSLDPSLSKENGSSFIYSVNWFRCNGLIAWFKIHVVLVREHLKFFAILLSGNSSWYNSARWSATANGMLCWTKKTSMLYFCMQYFIVKVRIIVAAGWKWNFSCRFDCFLILLMDGSLQCSLTSLIPMCAQETDFLHGINKTHVDC